MKKYMEQLKMQPLFDGICTEDLPQMLKCLGGYVKTYRKGEIIFLESQEISSIGIILSGGVQMIKEDQEGNKALLLGMKVGELFGETFVCASRQDARVSYVVAVAATVLFLPFYKVTHSCVHSCNFHHRVIENMVRLISDKNILLLDKIEATSKKTLREKILCYLRNQAERAGSAYFTIPLGRIELADYLCADRSALTRELTQMREDGLIDYDKNTFRLFVSQGNHP